MAERNRFAGFGMNSSFVGIMMNIALSQKIGLLFGALGVILGTIGLVRYFKDPSVSGKGRSVAAIILGILVMAWSILGVIAKVASNRLL